MKEHYRVIEVDAEETDVAYDRAAQDKCNEMWEEGYKLVTATYDTEDATMLLYFELRS